MSFYNTLPQEALADLLRAYDSYISTAADAGLLTTGWTPVCVEEFYGAEYQNVWDSEKGDESFYYMYDHVEAMMKAEVNELPIPNEISFPNAKVTKQDGEFYCQFSGEEVLRPVRSDIWDIEAGDAFIVGKNIYCANDASHQNYDEPDEPWIVYDTNGNGWFEEDIVPARLGIRAVLKDHLEKSGPKPSLADKILQADSKASSSLPTTPKEHNPQR